MRGTEVKLPECGIFVGSGIYAMSKDYLLCTLHGHQSWMSQSYSPLEMIDKIVEDNQGNLAQFWGYARGYAPATHAEWFYALDEIGVTVPEPDWEKGTNIRLEDSAELREHADRRGAGILRFAKAAAEKGIYTALIYTDGEPQWSAQLKDLGEHYLGYNFGERFTFRLDDASLKGKSLDDVNLRMLADDLVARVRAHVDEHHAAGWGNVQATSSNFYIDYEVAAGTDIPLVEDFAFQHLNMASALSRGLYRQHDLPLWGSHMAHEHYSWLPNRCEHKFDLLKAGMYLKYMSGCKMIINESGNWFVEASLYEDSPKFEFPRVPLTSAEVSWSSKELPKFIPYIEEARKHYHKVNYHAPVCRRYRKEISDFYDFVKANGTPAGQPEATVAIAKGNYDLCGQRFSPNAAVGGAYALADRNPAWFEGAPERGWNIVQEAFFPRPPVLAPYRNPFLSGTPYGMVDIVSFAMDQLEADVLNSHYKALLFAGWNTASDKQYEVLRSYVANGGTLFISIPQLSTNVTRNYGDYGVDELVNGGDFSELCGVKVKGRGNRFYWATAPDGVEELGFAFPHRFGNMSTCMGDIEITDAEAETLVVDDEQAEPLLLRRQYGKGTVYFLNSWAYPGALDQDEGPGSDLRSPGLVGMIYRHIAARSRGHVWVTDEGQDGPGPECDYMAFSYFPQPEKTLLLNIDFEHSRRCCLHRGGTAEHVELGPAEFRIVE